MFLFRENQVIAGKYRLERQVAKGGMGAVWTARNLQLGIPVAVKFMAPEAIGSAELVARFEREARAAAQLRSPHVVHIYEHGVVHDTPYMVMELLEGEDLSKRLRTRGRLSMAETARIVVEVSKALRRAHEQNIVHRDLKPGNVFLCRHDEDEIVKVLDFGIAKVLAPGPDDEVTKTGALVGTPHYMSPEQARRSQKDVDHRTDLWALGVIAYRALTGRLPFAGETAIDVILRVCSDGDPIPPPSSIAPELGPEVDRFFVRALARRPEERFQSAREMAEAMNALVPRAGGAAVHPLGQSWAESGPHPLVPPVGGSPPAHAPLPVPPAHGSLHQPPVVPVHGAPVQAPPAALQNVHMTEQKVYTSAGLASPPRPAVPPRAAEDRDPLGIAPTVPIGRSAAGQALLRGGKGPGGTLPIEPAAAGVPAPSVHSPAHAGASGGWPTQAPGRSPAAASGDVAGTITSAATETSPLFPTSRQRSPWIVWVAAAAAVLVVGVVGWAAVLGMQTVDDEPPIIPLPVPPPPEPAASVSATPGATASASAALSPSASATASPSASSVASPSASAAASPSTPVTSPRATAPRATSPSPGAATSDPKKAGGTAPAAPEEKRDPDTGMMTSPKF